MDKDLKNINDNLRLFENHIRALGDTRIHKDNSFNRRFSVVLESFSDVETLALRLQENIKKVEDFNREIQVRNLKEDAVTIFEEGQVLRRELDKIDNNNRVDLKSIHIFTKIFLDHYTSLFKFIFNWPGISDRSITSFNESLKVYSGTNFQVIDFKKSCEGLLEEIFNLITDYRDKSIVHNQTGHKETKWFLTDVNGGVQLIGKQKSLTPEQVINLTQRYIQSTVNFLLKEIR